jgi:hypothetical protein
VCVIMVLFHSPFGQSKFKRKNTKMFHEVLKEINSHCLGRVLVEHSSKMWDLLMNFALLSWLPDSFPSSPWWGEPIQSRPNWNPWYLLLTLLIS